MVQKIVKYFCSLIIFLSLLPFLILVLPIYLIRLFVGYVLVPFYPEVDKLLPTRSAVVGSDSLEKTPKLALIVVFTSEGTLSIDDVRHICSTQVLNQKLEDGRFETPEFRQYVTNFYGFLAWRWESNFQLTSHIKMYEGKYSGGNDTVNMDGICDIMRELVYKPFQPRKSPWEIHVVPNYRDTDPVSGEAVGPLSTAYITRMHHCMGDGFSILNVMSKMVESKRLNTALPNYVGHLSGSTTFKVMRALDLLLSAPFDFLSEILGGIDINSWHVSEKQLRRVTNFAVSPPISIDLFKEIKNRLNVSFIAVLFDCFTAAARRFMMEAGYDVPDYIHCITPLPFPGHPDTLSNHMTGCFIRLPVGLSESAKRIEAIEENIEHLKRSSFPLTAFYMIPLMGGLFRWMVPFLVRSRMVTAIMSNFPGPNEALYAVGLGHRITNIFFAAGFADGDIGIGFTALSYNGNMRITVGIDEGIVPRAKVPAEKLTQYFSEELEILKHSFSSNTISCQPVKNGRTLTLK